MKLKIQKTTRQAYWRVLSETSFVELHRNTHRQTLLPPSGIYLSVICKHKVEIIDHPFFKCMDTITETMDYLNP